MDRQRLIWSLACLAGALAVPGVVQSQGAHPPVRDSEGHVIVGVGGFDGARQGMETVLATPGGTHPPVRARVVEVRDRESVVQVLDEDVGKELVEPLEVRFIDPLHPSGKVVIATAEPPDEVRVDGTSHGDATHLYLEEGRHKLHVAKFGHEPWGTHVDVLRGETTEVRPDFPDIPLGRALVHVPGGTFVMGSDRGARDERPPHSVTLGPFYIRSCEVTCAEYWSFDPSHKNRTHGDASHPADNLNWWDAATFCNWLSEKEGLRPFYEEKGLKARAETLTVDWSADGYRLPTEAEWEFACRAGTQTVYYWGDSPDDRYMWYSTNAEGSTHPVATRLPNPLGLRDMSGNIAEWCNDWYDPSYYGASPERAPRGPAWGTHRVIRGGSWQFDAQGCRSADRFFLRPLYKFEDLGFRLVRPAPD